MTKSIAAIITLTVMLLFIWGCQPEKQQSDTTRQAGEPQIGISDSEPKSQQAEPETVESQLAKPQQAQPQVVETEQIEPEQARVREQQPQTSQEQAQKDQEAERGAKSEILSERPAFYDACDHIFATYVDKEGLVDYNTLRRKRAELINAVRRFDQVHPAQKMSWTNNEKIAFWINAHNIFTLKLIVDNYPIQPRWYLINYPDSSIMQIVGGRDKKYFNIMGMEYTLREIEKEILMKRFGDPRIFFALSYASMGGAFLRNEPYYPEKLDQQLDEQTRKFLSRPRGLRIDKNNKIIFLADIFNWYKPAFIEKYGSVKKFRARQKHIQSYLNFVAGYVSTENVGYFESDNYKVEFQLYDWRLNEQP